MDILDRLAKSKFRSKFKLRAKELEYIKEKRIDTIYSYACNSVVWVCQIYTVTYAN
ncbi:DUF4186 family protein [bacterium]|nr:DUF4186 family protein [bacterium]